MENSDKSIILGMQLSLLHATVKDPNHPVKIESNAKDSCKWLHVAWHFCC